MNKNITNETLIPEIETFIKTYATLADERYSLPLALWILGTHSHMEFDTFPYIVITSATKRSGKTRLSEIMSFAVANPRNFAAVGPSQVFRSIRDEHPTLVFDEAERLSRDGATDMRAILNVGYRKGQSVPRTVGQEIVEFPTYCPKIFILIGDVTDTLRDRAIVIEMRRAEARARFVFNDVKDAGAVLRGQCSYWVKSNLKNIEDAFREHSGLSFLEDREEEIWTPLFVLCSLICPARMKELSMIAADMSADKTIKGRRYTQLAQEEDKAMEESYRNRLLVDLYGVMVTNGKVLRSAAAIE